jgi:hypothetical protein
VWACPKVPYGPRRDVHDRCHGAGQYIYHESFRILLARLYERLVSNSQSSHTLGLLVERTQAELACWPAFQATQDGPTLRLAHRRQTREEVPPLRHQLHCRTLDLLLRLRPRVSFFLGRMRPHDIYRSTNGRTVSTSTRTLGLKTRTMFRGKFSGRENEKGKTRS